MSILARISAGKVVKEFGSLQSETVGLTKRGRAVLLTERYGQLRFVPKSFARAAFLSSVVYRSFALDGARKLGL